MADKEDFDDKSMGELDALEAAVLESKTSQRAATHSLPEMMVRSLLTPTQIAKIRRDPTTCLVIEAPSSEWVLPLPTQPRESMMIRSSFWNFASLPSFGGLVVLNDLHRLQSNKMNGSKP